MTLNSGATPLCCVCFCLEADVRQPRIKRQLIAISGHSEPWLCVKAGSATQKALCGPDMSNSRKHKAILGLVAGTALFCGLFLWRGIDTVFGLLDEAGIALVLICLFSPPEQMLAAEAWRSQFPPSCRPGRTRTLLASGMGSAVKTLLPVATIGGEIAKARILILWSHPGAETAGAMTVDKTIQAIAVLIWGLVGAVFLVFFVGESGAVAGILVGAGFLILGIAGFIAVQIKGGFSLIAEKVGVQAGKDAGEVIAQGAEAFASRVEAEDVR